ncbi:hypothetical protein QQ056_16135 [Oscillatoria laete-virens NRMC-F 0139]|nr:hypothetical protein [Oscillatoria laete-virens]MDL5055068.1 hypothetical protein [Oscillatoria laete-virens NRMC-F 0139]
MAEMKAKGEPTTLREMVGPEIPADENFAEFFRPLVKNQDESLIFQDRKKEIESIMNALSKHNLEELMPSVMDGKSAGFVDNVIFSSSDRHVIGDYLSYIGKPQAQFSILYSNQIYSEVHHYLALRLLQKAICLRALQSIEANDRDNAFKETKAGFDIVNHMQSDIYLVPCMINTTLFMTAIQPYWEGLERHFWTDQQLLGFQNVFKRINFENNYIKSMREDNLFAFSLAGMSVEDLYYACHPVRRISSFKDNIRKFLYRLYPASYFYHNARYLVDYNQKYMSILNDNVEYSQKIFKIENLVTQISENSNPYRKFAKLNMLNKVNAYKLSILRQIILEMGSISVYLERYYLKHKEYPESLEQLVPEFVVAVPVDRYDGKPLRYQRLGKASYRLYSVGPNLTDDGGVRGQDKSHADGDLVWEVGVN